jgi:tRNA(Ile)-lysidine synthase
MKPTTLNTAVRRALEAAGLPSAGQILLCGLSGGPDSVALTDALASLAKRRGFTVVAAHLDHGLRAASHADEAFCSELCERLGVRLVCESADVRRRARRERMGIEEAGREARYGFLRRVKNELGAVAIAVAHTEDDQAETFLMRLLRGSGGAGLSAMRVRSGDIVRPLLAVSREDVLAYLQARGLSSREDETNRDTTFTRSRVRHELIPYLERHFNPRVRRALARAAELLAGEQELLGSLVPPPALLADGSVALEVAELRQASLGLCRLRIRRALEVTGGLRGVGEVHIRRIARFARRPYSSGRHLALPGGRIAAVSFDRLRIGPRREEACRYAFPLHVPGRVELPDGLALVAEPASGGLPSKEKGAIVAVPAGPLEVRTRRPGDRVLVRGRVQSLKRYLIARRVPAEARERLPLVTAGREVLWMPGQPLSGGGEHYVRLHLEPA